MQSANAQQNTIINNELGLRDFQDDIDALEKKLTVLEQVRDTANQTRNEIQAASDLDIENNDRDTATQRRLNEISNQQAAVESGALIQQTAQREIPEQVSDFADAAINELENEGATAEVINAAKEQINAVAQETREALADGFLDQSEQTQIAQQIAEISQAFSLSNQSIINNQNLLLNSISALTSQQEIQAEQIRATANNIQSR